MRMKLALIGAVVVAVLAAVYWSGAMQREPIPDHLLNTGGDFTLQSADGPVALQDLRGKVVLIYFGYTNCPDACPMTMSNWASAFERLSDEERSRVQGMLVSVDPARDSLEHLKEYTAYFHPNIIGVTGSEAELQAVALQYRSDYVIENEDGSDDYEVAHMSFVYVIDPEGQVRRLLAHDTSPTEVVQTIRHVLKVAG